MFYFILCISHLIVFCLMLFTGFNKINLDVHSKCMSIVNDATQNQNWLDLTKSEIIGLPESSFSEMAEMTKITYR